MNCRAKIFWQYDPLFLHLNISSGLLCDNLPVAQCFSLGYLSLIQTEILSISFFSYSQAPVQRPLREKLQNILLGRRFSEAKKKERKLGVIYGFQLSEGGEYGFELSEAASAPHSH